MFRNGSRCSVVSAVSTVVLTILPADVKAIAEERFAARVARDWAKSDELRNKLAEMGYAVKDSKEGYTLTKN